MFIALLALGVQLELVEEAFLVRRAEGTELGKKLGRGQGCRDYSLWGQSGSRAASSYFFKGNYRIL